MPFDYTAVAAALHMADLGPPIHTACKRNDTQGVCSVLQAFFWDILLPTHYVRVGWDMLMLILLGYVCLVLPFVVGFDIHLVRLSTTQSGFLWQCVSV